MKSSLGLFIIHNVVRRNLQSCYTNATSVSRSTAAPFLTYARYTIFVTEDQLDSVDTIWFPTFGKYDDRFNAQIQAHEALRSSIASVKKAVDAAEGEPDQESLWQAVSDAFRDLHQQTESTYDKEEALSNGLGHQIPMDVIKELEKQQEQRRRASVKTYGHLWCASYLLKSMNPQERAIFPPGLPKLVANGMMSGGAMHYRR